MALIGKAGTGKTLLLRLLLNEIGDEKITALILCPYLTPSGLMHLLVKELGETAPESADTASLYTLFQHKLISSAKDNKEVLIIIDEAQNLPVETLEQLRMLSNIELNDRKLLQILLVGQPELEKLLNSPQLSQLSQRISVYEHLSPLSLTDCIKYVQFRFAKAGRNNIIVSRSAVRILFRKTGGIPRLINRLMDRALLFASAERSGNISGRHIRQACSTLPEGRSTAKAFSSLPGSIIYLLIIIIAIFASYLYLSGK